MNAADNKAATVSTESLLNFESVKHFSNEALELARYDTALQAYERAAIKTTTSLSTLNMGQNAIISTALTIMVNLLSIYFFCFFFC